MEHAYGDSTEDLRLQLELLDTRQELSDKEAERRFILWYEEICKERLVMLNTEEEYKRKIEELETAEEGYRTRINELEDGTISLLKSFEESQLEIKALRDKYERNGSEVDIFNEPYDVVSKERNRLKEENVQNKEKIRYLSEEVKVLRHYENNREYNRNKNTGGKTYKDRQLKRFVKDNDYSKGFKREKVKYSKDSLGKLVVITSSEKLKNLEMENVRLKMSLDKLKGENNFLVSKVELLETQLQSKEQVSTKKYIRGKTSTDSTAMDKKHIQDFLPKLRSDSTDVVAEKHRPDLISSLTYRPLDIPFMRYGLGYKDLYKCMLKRQQSNDKDVQSSYPGLSLTNYMI